MNKYLFIAEKPSAMRAVKAAYDKNRSQIEKTIGSIDFVALAGHVCRYLELKEYPAYQNDKGDPMSWRDIVLPVDVDMKVATGQTKSAIERVRTVKDMLAKTKYDGIIVGTDSDVEGNGIYWLLMNRLKLQKHKTLRFFEQSLTEKEILRSLNTMTDFFSNPRDVHMTESYVVRSQFDWRVGMNATIGLTVKSGKLCKVGRVKAPTIKLVCDNSDAIDNFVPHSDYLIDAEYDQGFNGTLVDEKGPVAFATSKNAANWIAGVKERKATVTAFTSEDAKTPPPQFHKLSTLQVEAGKEYGYNPEKTLELVQSLYEKHLVSYPRTDGMYLSTEAADEIPSYLDHAKCVPELIPVIKTLTADMILSLKKNRRYVNDVEVAKASHTALMPVGAPNMQDLSKDEQNIFGLICKRLVAAFLGDLIEKKTKLDARVDGAGTFHSTGTRMMVPGWRTLYPSKEKQDPALPENIKVGDVLTIRQFKTRERKATPPKRLTTATLLDAMENISRYIEDKELRKVMRDAKGLGTPATRARIINDIIDAGYVRKSGKNEALFITDAGRSYMKVVGKFSICDPSESARFETMFQAVKEGSKDLSAAMHESEVFIKNMAEEINKQKATANEIADCPYCTGKVLRNSWGYGCSNWKSGCNFAVNNKNGAVTDDDVRDLVSKGQTRVIAKIVTSAKTGKAYDAAIKLEPQGAQYPTSYLFAEKQDSGKDDIGIECPWCSNPLQKTQWGYGCSNWKNGCKFGVNNKAGVITVDDIRDLVEHGQTRLITGIGRGKDGKPFDAILELKRPGESAYATAYKFPEKK